MKSKSARNLIFFLVGILAIALLSVAFFRFNSGRVVVPSEQVLAPERQGDASPPAPVEKKRQKPKPKGDRESSKKRSAVEESAFAVNVEGNPLMVILPWYEEIGKISVEKYDKDMEPTGERVKSGTMVQIPDPFKPGEKIFFVVP